MLALWFEKLSILLFVTAEKAKLQSRLSDAQYISLTTDGWSSRNSESYITTTAHWLDGTWSLQSAVLRTTQLQQSHTSDNLLSYTQEVIKDWNLERGLPIPITTDNASNITKAIREGRFLHVRCFAHTINLAAQKGLSVKVVNDMLSHIRRIVKYFNKSCLANAILKEKQLVTDTPVHVLINDCPTRWNSTHDMLARFKEQYNAIFAVLYSTNRLKTKDLSDLRTHLAAVDCDVISSVCEVLKPLKAATTCICSESSVTVSSIGPIKFSLMAQLVSTSADSDLVKTLKLAIANNLAERYTDPEQIEMLHVATALDPRFKKLPYLPASKRDEIYRVLTDKAVQLKSTEEADQPTSIASGD